MMRRLSLVIVLFLLALPAAAIERPAGLMWNHSGLPLTLPLQVKSDPGADLYLQLSDPATGQAVLAAYVRGGAFFRVLVPPGRWALTFARGRDAQGQDWQGEDGLFGAATEVIALPEPLVFQTEGAARKSGHLIDLRGASPVLRDIGLCQRRALDPDSLSRSWARQHPHGLRDPREPGPFTAPRYDLRSHFCDDAG